LRKNFKVEYLGQFKAIFKNVLEGYSGAPEWLNHEINGGQKSQDTVSLTQYLNLILIGFPKSAQPTVVYPTGISSPPLQPVPRKEPRNM